MCWCVCVEIESNHAGRLPPRPRRTISHPQRQFGDKGVQLCRLVLQHAGLLQIVGRRMITVGAPVVLDAELGRVSGKAELERQRGDTFADKAELVHADKRVAIGHRIGNQRQTAVRRHRAGIVAQRAFAFTDRGHGGQRPQRQRHVEIEIRDDRPPGHRRTHREIVRSQQALFLGRDDHEQDRPARPVWPAAQPVRDIQHRGHARCIVHRAGVNRPAVDRCADPQMIKMRRQHDILPGQLRIAARQTRDQIGRCQCRLMRNHAGLKPRCQRKWRHRARRIGQRAQLCKTVA